MNHLIVKFWMWIQITYNHIVQFWVHVCIVSLSLRMITGTEKLRYYVRHHLANYVLSRIPHLFYLLKRSICALSKSLKNNVQTPVHYAKYSIYLNIWYPQPKLNQCLTAFASIARVTGEFLCTDGADPLFCLSVYNMHLLYPCHTSTGSPPAGILSSRTDAQRQQQINFSSEKLRILKNWVTYLL